MQNYSFFFYKTKKTSIFQLWSKSDDIVLMVATLTKKINLMIKCTKGKYNENCMI